MDKIEWQELPGIYERHLQRRHNNPLFSKERRNVSLDDVKIVRNLDNAYQKEFVVLSTLLTSEYARLNDKSPINDFLRCLQDVQEHIQLGSRIGGNLEHEIGIAEGIENKLTSILNERFPEGADMLKTARAHSEIQRIPYLAQLATQEDDPILKVDTPILENEQTAALLSEDVETVKLLGYFYRSLQSKKITEDVHKCLEDGIKNGLDKGYAKEVLEAWNG